MFATVPTARAFSILGPALLLAALASPAAAQEVDCVEHLARTRQAVERFWSFLIFKPGGYDLPGTQQRLEPDARAATTPDACADVLDRFIATLKDGHANLISFPGRTRQALPRGIRLQRFTDRIVRPGFDRPMERLHVVAIDTAEASVRDIPIGSEVLTIDGKPAQDVLAYMQERVSASTVWGLMHWTDRLVLRGPAGTDVTLTLRTPAGELREVTLPRPSSRDEGDETYVEHEKLDDGWGYIRLTSFEDRAIIRQFDQALDALMDTPGLIIDLRDNGGGRVDVLEAITGRFFNRNMVIARIMIRNPGEQVVTRSPESIVARRRGRTYTRPVVLLVNAGCFSACDIFTSAMEEHGRALIIGPTRTGGGSASPVAGGLFDTFNGAEIRLSYFIAYRGDDTQIESFGIAPHITVEPTLDDYIAGRDPILERARAALRQGEADFGAL